MHYCAPPSDALDVWLSADGSVKGGNYGHLLLEQQAPKDGVLFAALRTYFESAHLDAREHFHQQIGISLHPDGNVVPVVAYPACLPNKALRGLFGEVMAGLVTEAYKQEFVGCHDWHIPIFLFREHDDVEKYLWNLRDDPDRTREIYGRHGTDFVAISLNDLGEVERVIAGEAKWRKTLTDSVVATMLLGPKKENADTGEMEHSGKGIWFELNREPQSPTACVNFNDFSKSAIRIRMPRQLSQ